MSDLEPYTTGTGQKLLVHPASQCAGQFCPIHNPSNHSMRDFPTHWRHDRALMERICPHGIGHPDPDDIAFKRRIYDKKYKRMRPKFPFSEGIHGCDGCCSDKKRAR